ncbi:hypothetical protein BLNAU_20723 [Blattamonas nauphoetae]|uniref:Protein kinase domain-containing protein n=1 Tax=Blattamonas nauphoetae TaxID=2049346 RepID=A0ABQ9WXY1_9EUKA|nr:hypothetical protein BLNAU_20723 [Blattamonas nauphoetae]
MDPFWKSKDLWATSLTFISMEWELKVCEKRLVRELLSDSGKRRDWPLTDTNSSKECGIGWKNVVIADWMLQRLRHLDQKMLGCVVSLTSSHLSGSTIRDVNTVGCVLCSNSSFSSLLSSPNTDSHTNEEPSIIVDGSNQFEFKDGTEYRIDSTNQSTSVTFSHCHFTSPNYQSNVRPLTLIGYPGSLTLLSCSFTNIVHPTEQGGAVYLASSSATQSVRIELCNFTDCSALKGGGSLYLDSKAVLTLTGCRCVGCSVAESSGYSAGGMSIKLKNSPESTMSDLYFEACTSPFAGGGLLYRHTGDLCLVSSLSFKECSVSSSNLYGDGGGMAFDCSFEENRVDSASHLKFEDCWTPEQGGGLYVGSSSDYSLCLTDCEFINCKATNYLPKLSFGGGFCDVMMSGTLTVEGCQFIDCSSTLFGGAVAGDVAGFVMSDCLVKNCHSTSSAAVDVDLNTNSPIALTNVLFVGNNEEDTPTYFNTEQSTANNVQFADFEIQDEWNNNPTDISITDCYTTTTPNSVGMYSSGNKPVDHPAFHKMGPLLTQNVEAKLDGVWMRVDVIVKGKVPLESQIYEVRLKETEGSAELTGELQFVNGVGSLLPSSNLNLQFSTAYTITSIVGVVPSSSESNAIPITAEAWAFNLATTPNLLSFTTPDQPPTLLASTAHLTDASQPFAFIILLFDQEVSGSYDIVVEEEGRDVTITVAVVGTSFEGESENFRVVGEDRLLTHDTTYTIKSIVPTEGSATATTVWMNKTIRFHIPKSSYVPPEKDDKKTMSPETKKLLSWLIPLVVCLLIALVLAIIVIVLLRRRQQKSAVPAENEMETQEPIEVEKVEEFGVDCSNGVIRTDDNHASSLNSNKENRPDNETGKHDPSQFGEVMACSGDFKLSTARMDSTLYSMLHKEHRDVWKRGVGVQIVNGLKQVVAHRPASDVLTRLSSHWILIDGSGNVQLKLQMTREEAEQEAAHAQMQNPQPLANLEQDMNQPAEMTQEAHTEKSGMDGLRWRAPEVVLAGGVVGQVDGSKASVFSLGLILWEIETGQVPFGELDAVNAQRQSGTGIGPKMESLENEEFISLIHRCVSVDPNHRPTLSEIGEFLSSHPDETRVGSGMEMKE